MDKRLIEKIIMGVLIGCAALILIVAVLMFYRRHIGNRETAPAETETQSGVIREPESIDYFESYSYDFSDMGLVKDGYPEINELIGRYLEANLNGDYTTLNNIVRSEVPYGPENTIAQNSLFDSFSNISCYTYDGLVENTFLTYVTYDAKLKNVETPAPSMIRVYVVKDADGTVYIDENELSGELKAYMDSADNEEDVQILRAEINRRMKEACARDKNLNGVYQAMMNGSLTGGTQAETQAPAPTPESAAASDETVTAQTEAETAESAGPSADSGSESRSAESSAAESSEGAEPGNASESKSE